MNPFDPFLSKYPASSDNQKLSEKDINDYLQQLPAYFLDLLKEHGFGVYGDGILQLINPNEYHQTLIQWLGKDNPNYMPIALGAFGELYYYRKLADTAEDVCYIDPAYKSINICTWDLKEFFNSYLVDDSIVRKEMFDSVKSQLGILKSGEIYTLKLAPALGGDDNDPENRAIGDAKVHLDILFQM